MQETSLLDKFEDADFKYDYSLSKIAAQKHVIFVPSVKVFIFAQSFPFWKGYRRQIWQTLFQTTTQKYSHKVFLVLNLEFFVLHETLSIQKFEAVDFKRDKVFFFSNLKNFLLLRNFVLRCSFEIWNYKLKAQNLPKTVKYGIFSPPFKDCKTWIRLILSWY